MPAAHPDWFFNAVTVHGPADDVWSFRMAAAGAGVVPWVVDYDRYYERALELMLTTTDPRTRSVSLEGCRILARKMRDAYWEEHEDAVTRVGRDKSCHFDLHSLVECPWSILRLGPDDPKAIEWMMKHWGVIWPLRQVDGGPPPPSRRPRRLRRGHATWEARFWSADWTPWPVIQACRARWPSLTFDVFYDLTGPAFPERTRPDLDGVADAASTFPRPSPDKEVRQRQARFPRELADATQTTRTPTACAAATSSGRRASGAA